MSCSHVAAAGTSEEVFLRISPKVPIGIQSLRDVQISFEKTLVKFFTSD